MSVFRPLKKGSSERNPYYYTHFMFQGQRVYRNTLCTSKAEALKFEKQLRAMLAAEKRDEMFRVLDTVRLRKSGKLEAKMGQVFDAWYHPEARAALLDRSAEGAAQLEWDHGFLRVRKASAISDARRCLNDLLSVIAWAKDLWVERIGYAIQKGSHVPDEDKIRELPVSILNADLVREYLEKRCASELGVVSWADGRQEHTRINNMVLNARDMLRDKCWFHIYEPLGIARPEKLNDFLTFQLLQEAEPEPAPLSSDEFAAVVKAGEAALLSDDQEWREVGLVCLLMRQTGIRPGSIEMAQRDWLEQRSDGWWLVLRSVKSGTRTYDVPLSDRLGEMLAKREDGFLIAPWATANKRFKIIFYGLNKLVKGALGISGRSHGAYRLRDTVAAVCRSWLGMDIAVEMLGHEDGRTTRKHYARIRQDVSDLMKEEIGAAQRLVRRLVS